ncbi:MAG TPA: alpha-hydroxy-acid oxidizing protein [Acidimicrobiales bacterium]|nr:alpha-hydroxy-acid oxidizing protein [Acidimicrobiales bacterium]
MAGPFASFQDEIYLAGTTGVRPPFTTDLAGLEAAARQALEPRAFGYVAGGAGSMSTVRANRAAFERWRIVPRMLRDVSRRDLATTVLGTPMPAPVLLAPVGVQTIVHPEGELASARAAAALGLVFVHSTAAAHSIEEVAEASGDGPRWYQLYWPRDRAVAASLVSRAEAAGYAALVVTVDTFALGWRPVDLDAAYLPFLEGVGIANYLSDPAFNRSLPPGAGDVDKVLRWAGIFGDPSLTWDDLAWLRRRTSLPLVVKGILHPQDARAAVAAGVDGIVVSNHGGRQVDGALASLDALPAVLDEVAGAVPVVLDSGVRTGADVVKAISLGAAAVLYGRPYVYGLGLGGQEGVEQVLRCLLGELDATMALSGQATLADLGADVLVRP